MSKAAQEVLDDLLGSTKEERRKKEIQTRTKRRIQVSELAPTERAELIDNFKDYLFAKDLKRQFEILRQIIRDNSDLFPEGERHAPAMSFRGVEYSRIGPIVQIGDICHPLQKELRPRMKAWLRKKIILDDEQARCAGYLSKALMLTQSAADLKHILPDKLAGWVGQLPVWQFELTLDDGPLAGAAGDKFKKDNHLWLTAIKGRMLFNLVDTSP